MKFKSLFLTIAVTVATMAAMAQSGFSYQAVVRNSKGELVSNKNVGLRITLTDQEGKQNFYQEVQSVPTNAYGVLSTTIGAADTTVLKNLKWNDGVWMRVEIDAAGGTKYTDMGLTPIQAVPYALYAANGGKGAKGDKGDPGEPGTGLSNRGAWSAGSYKAGEYVFAPSAADPAVNTMWIAQRDIDASTSAPTVGEDWVEFHAPKGDKGEQGEQGVGISGTSFNNDDHTLTITLTNGQTFTTQSLQGPQGLQGEQGPAGPQGNPGTGLTNRGAWNAANTYKVGDYVFASSSASAEVNSMWIAQNDNISSSVQPKDDAANWVEFQAQRGEQGPQGPAGRDGMQVEGTEGQTLVHNGTTWVATDQLSVKKLDVTGKSTSSGEALFEVKDKDGNVVFAVYPDGVCVYVDESKSADKVRSGLVVTSRPATKDGTPQDYLVVNTNGTQVIVDQDESKVRSGLIVTKRPATKGEEAQDYLVVNPNGTQVIVDQNDDKVRSGLIVTKRPATKGEEAQDYLVVNPNGTQVIVDQNDDKVRSGLIVTKRPATKGEEAQDYLVVNPNGTQVIVDQNDSKVRSGLIVTKRPATKDEEAQDYLVVNPNGTQVIVDDELECDTKAKRSGFVVTSRPATKDDSPVNYLKVATDGTKISFDESSSKAKRSGIIVTSRPATKEGEETDVMEVTPDSTRVYVNGGGSKSGFAVEEDGDGSKAGGSKSGFAVTEKGANGKAGYMNVTADNFLAGYNSGKRTKPTFENEVQMGVNNTFVGNNAGFKNQKSMNNVFIGNKAGYSTNGTERLLLSNPLVTDKKDTTVYGSDNVFLGNNSGYTNSTGYSNVFLGNNAGLSNTTGYNNVFVGYYSGAKNIAGYNNIFIGNKAAVRKSSGNSNIFMGTNAGNYSYYGDNNIVLGTSAAYLSRKMNRTIAIGNSAGYGNNATTESTDNVFIGYCAGYKINTGSNNVMLGNKVGFNNTNGSSNVFIGDSAAYSNTEGKNNVFMGKNAGFTNAKGDDNVFIGNEAGYSTNSTNDDCWIWDPFEGELVPGRNGSNNVFLGKRSGYSNTTGYNNVFLGNFAGWHNTTGDNNIFIGFNTGSHTNGTNNILIGNQVDLEGDSDNNIMIGAQTSYDNESYLYGEEGGYLNIGDLIQGKLYSGSGFEISDQNCGKLLVNGTIKAYSILPKFSNSNISHYYYRSNLGGATERWDTLYVGNINIASNRGGNLGGQIIGNLIPSTEGLPSTENSIECQSLGSYNRTQSKYNLWDIYANDVRVFGNATFDNGLTIKGDVSSISAYGQLGCFYFTTNNSTETTKTLRPRNNNAVSLGTSAYKWTEVYAVNGTIQTSDQRLKTNIKPLEKALDKVLTLNGVTYNWRVKEFPDKNFDSKTHVGVLAQEVEAVLPEAVETGEDGYKSVKYSEITPLLIEAVKELKAEKDNLQAIVESQQQQIDELKRLVEELLKK